MTVHVVVDSIGTIIEAPIVKRFVGLPLQSLTRWMRKQGRFATYKLPQ